MSAILPGYNYDIFISYRQKDNRHDGWVTEFVNNLKDELESIFKEEISVYFDINPHDGLLETHDVDESLKDKLKCLIFIPIISRTYCDPKSFAWEHEFKAFVEMAKKDPYGLKIKLLNGNVSSRVLPVQIHDLKEEDRREIARELGGFLRPVEFVYSEPGVNRPLTKTDTDEKNLNKTNYRNQINKVANAVDEICSSLSLTRVKNQSGQEPGIEEVTGPGVMNRNHAGNPLRHTRHRLITGAVILTVLIISTLLILISFQQRNEPPGITSVAILPFKNMSGNEKYDNWQTGIQDELISKISETDELKILPADIINSGLKEPAGKENFLSRKNRKRLHAGLSITGTITGSGTLMRINAQIIDNSTGRILQPYGQDAAAGTGLFDLIDPLSQQIKSYLIIRSLKDEVYIDPERMGYSDDAEAYRYFTYGQKEFAHGSYPEAIKLLSEAVRRDSNLIYATLHIGWAYHDMNKYDSAKMWCQKVWKRKDTLPLNQQRYVEYVHSFFFGGTPPEWLEKQKQLLEMDENWPHLHFDMGNSYFLMNRYNEAAMEYKKSLELYSKKGIKPWWSPNYSLLGVCYYKTGQYKKARHVLLQGLKYFPDDLYPLGRLVILSFMQGKTIKAEKYLNKYLDLCKISGITPVDQATFLADIYSEAGIPDKAEEFYLRAFKMDSRNLDQLYKYAYFLVDKTNKVESGLNYFEKALENNPDDYNCLYGKGWALFKLKRYKEASEILQRSWNLRLQNGWYDHEALLHLQAARDSLAAAL